MRPPSAILVGALPCGFDSHDTGGRGRPKGQLCPAPMVRPCLRRPPVWFGSRAGAGPDPLWTKGARDEMEGACVEVSLRWGKGQANVLAQRPINIDPVCRSHLAKVSLADQRAGLVRPRSCRPGRVRGTPPCSLWRRSSMAGQQRRQSLRDSAHPRTYCRPGLSPSLPLTLSWIPQLYAHRLHAL